MEWRGQCSGTVEGTVLHCKRSEKADTPTFCEMSSFISKNVGVSAFSLLLQWCTVVEWTVHQSPLCHIALGHCPLHYMCSSRAQCPITSSFISKNVGVSAFSLLLQWSTVPSTVPEHCPLHSMCSSRAQCPSLAPSFQKTSECPLFHSFCSGALSTPLQCTRVLSSLPHCTGALWQRGQ